MIRAVKFVISAKRAKNTMLEALIKADKSLGK